MIEETEQDLQNRTNRQDTYPLEVDSPIVREIPPEFASGFPAVTDEMSIKKEHNPLTKKKIALLAIVFF